MVEEGLMKQYLIQLFLQNWPRKCVAFISALVIWFLVNQSINITRTFPDVAIRVINLPQDKTVVGLLPNGLLNKRTSVTITGTKSVIADLRATDIEVVIDAEGKKESWMAKIDRRSLVNLSSEWDLMKSITDVSGSDVFMKMSRLVVEEIPVTIKTPIGDPPKGYQFLNVWPKQLIQRVSGPEEQVMALKKEGLEITYNLNKIKESDLLAALTTAQTDEFSYFIPPSLKQIAIQFRDNALEPLNDPRAKNLRLDFLKQEFISLGEKLQLSVFFPPKYSRTLNPEIYSLAPNTYVERKDGLYFLNFPLYVRDVSRLFLEVVRENIELTVIAMPKSVQKKLSWTLELINEKALEDKFVTLSMEQGQGKYEETNTSEELLRVRFRDYQHKLTLYLENQRPLTIEAELTGTTITLQVIQ